MSSKNQKNPLEKTIIKRYRLAAARCGMSAIIFDLQKEVIHIREPMRPSHEPKGG